MTTDESCSVETARDVPVRMGDRTGGTSYVAMAPQSEAGGDVPMAGGRHEAESTFPSCVGPAEVNVTRQRKLLFSYNFSLPAAPKRSRRAQSIPGPLSICQTLPYGRILCVEVNSPIHSDHNIRRIPPCTYFLSNSFHFILLPSTPTLPPLPRLTFQEHGQITQLCISSFGGW